MNLLVRSGVAEDSRTPATRPVAPETYRAPVVNGCSHFRSSQLPSSAKIGKVTRLRARGKGVELWRKYDRLNGHTQRNRTPRFARGCANQAFHARARFFFQSARTRCGSVAQVKSPTLKNQRVGHPAHSFVRLRTADRLSIAHLVKKFGRKGDPPSRWPVIWD